MLKKKYYYTTPKCVITVLASPIEGGVVSGGGTFSSGDTILISAVPNLGYNFVQWDDTYRELNRNIIVTQSKTYTAEFTNGSSPFTVTFDLNGHGSGTAPETLILDSTTGYYATKPTDPIDNTYSFMGWYTVASGGSQWSFINDEVKQDMTLYALWVYDSGSSSVYIKFPRNNSTFLIGYLYSGDNDNPKGLEIERDSAGSHYSICCIANDTPWGNPRIHESAVRGQGSRLCNSTCIVSVEEGTINSNAGLQLKGVSIDYIENGKLQYMNGTRTYDMPGTQVHLGVTCKYYEFRLPSTSQTITINLIWEPIT